MADTARLTFTGRLGRDPEDGPTWGNTETVKFSVACNPYAGKGKEYTLWFNVVVANTFFAKVALGLRKGDWVMIDGKLSAHEFKDQMQLDVVVGFDGSLHKLAYVDQDEEPRRRQPPARNNKRREDAPANRGGKKKGDWSPPDDLDDEIPF